MINSFEIALKRYRRNKQWLLFYENNFPKFWVQKQGNHKGKKFFTKWELFDSINNNYDWNVRWVFPTEIMIDIDCGEYNKALEIKQRIVSKIMKQGFNYSAWKSGGDGIHISLIFPELDNYKDTEREFIKREFLKHLEPNNDAIDLTTVYPKRLIALEYAIHRKGGLKELLDYDWIDNEHNKIPEIVLYKALQVKKKENNMKFIDNIEYSDKNKMKCIQFIEKGGITSNVKDFYRRAAFIYASLLKGKHSDEYIIKRLMKYLDMEQLVARDIVRYLSSTRCMSCIGRRKLLLDVGLGELCDKCHLNKTVKPKVNLQLT